MSAPQTGSRKLTLDDISDVRADERERGERSALLVLADGARVRAVVDEQHEQGLTREEVTAAVHYLR